MTRYYETTAKSDVSRESDFIYRNRSASVWRTGLYYLVGIIAIVFVYLLRRNIGGDVTFLAAVVLILGGLTVHSMVTVQKHLDLVTSIEFQNALFSSAFREGKLFSMIVSQDDQMYYADGGFYQNFPELAKSRGQVLDAMVQKSQHPEDNLSRITNALVNRTQQDLTLLLEIEEKQQACRVTIIPLPRPSGYFFVSAALTDKDDHELLPQSMSREETENILTALFAHVSDIAYMLDMNGRIIHCTQSFAEALRYTSPCDIRGQYLVSLLPEHQDSLPAAFALKELNHTLLVFRCNNGAMREAHVSHICVKDRHQSPYLTLGNLALS